MNREIVVLIDRQNTKILLDAVKITATKICLQSGVSISVVKTLVNRGYTSRLTLWLEIRDFWDFLGFRGHSQIDFKFK